MLDPNRTIQGNTIGCYVENRNRIVRVIRLPRRIMDRCRHDWGEVPYSYRGHGKWGRVCMICGKLGRV